MPRHRYFHAALALQRALEKRRVEVTATAMVGGVLDVERFFLLGMANTDTVTVPLYIAYLLLAYDDIYDVYRRPADVFRQPYATTCPACSTCGTSSTTCSRACRRPRGSCCGRRSSGPSAATRTTRSASACARTPSTAGDVTVRTLPGFDHVNSWVQAMPRAARYFRTLD